MPLDILDEAMAVAVEHIRWARSEGMSPAQIVTEYRLRPPNMTTPSWDEVTWAVALAWTHLGRLPMREAA